VRALSPEQAALFYTDQGEIGRSVDLGGGVKGVIASKFDPATFKPNVFVLPNFVQAEELSSVEDLAIANIGEFHTSQTGHEDEEGENVTRKSIFLCIPYNKHETIKVLASRAAACVGEPVKNVEIPQLLTYIGDGKKGDYFNLHHDIAEIIDDVCVEPSIHNDGDTIADNYAQYTQDPEIYRKVTCFVYFNSLPDPSQGRTSFPKLELSINPEAGLAALWPNVLPDGSINEWMIHEAEPVVSQGMQKYGMNLWVTSLDLSAQQMGEPGVNYSPDEQHPQEGSEAYSWQRRFRGEHLPQAKKRKTRKGKEQKA
jgi:hypothetical protein